MIDVRNPYTPTTDSPVEAEVLDALQGTAHPMPLASIMCPGCSAVYAAAEEVRPFLACLCRVCCGQGERAVIATRHVRGALEAVTAECVHAKFGPTPLTAERVIELRGLLRRISHQLAAAHPVQRHITRAIIELGKCSRRGGRPMPEIDL